MKRMLATSLLLLALLTACARPILIPSDREVIKLPDGRLSISQGYFLEIIQELNRCGER